LGAVSAVRFLERGLLEFTYDDNRTGKTFPSGSLLRASRLVISAHR